MTPPTLVVIEDDVPLRDLLVELLTDAGYAIVALAHPPIEAPVPRADLVLSDLFLPVYHLEAAQAYVGQLQTFWPRAPVVVLTAHRIVEPEDVALGAAAVVLKPFELESLLDVIAQQLPGHG